MIQNIKTYTKNKYPDRVSKCNAIGRLLRYMMIISIVLLFNDVFSDEVRFIVKYSVITYLLVIPIISVVQFIDRKKNKEKYQISINLFLWVIILLITLFFMMLNGFETQCKNNCQEEHLSTNCNDYCS